MYHIICIYISFTLPMLIVTFRYGGVKIGNMVRTSLERSSRGIDLIDHPGDLEEDLGETLET